MTEKKIDLSNVVVGQKLWSAERGECFVTLVGENTITTGCIPKFSRYDKNGIVSGTTNTVPTLFHSREEFLEFHSIAPVRMTRSVLNISFQNSERQYSSFVYYEMGYKLAGGQIIEEPKNLPCPKCGCDMARGLVDWKLRHPAHNYCSLSGIVVDRDLWNDESKRGKV